MKQLRNYWFPDKLNFTTYLYALFHPFQILDSLYFENSRFTSALSDYFQVQRENDNLLEQLKVSENDPRFFDNATIEMFYNKLQTMSFKDYVELNKLMITSGVHE